MQLFFQLIRETNVFAVANSMINPNWQDGRGSCRTQEVWHPGRRESRRGSTGDTALRSSPGGARSSPVL